MPQLPKTRKSWMTTTRIRSSPGAPSRSPIILEAPRQETVPVVRNSGQSSQQPGLPDSPRPPGRLLDPLDKINLDQRFLMLLPLERGPIPQREKIQTRTERNTSLESSHNRMSFLSFNHIFSFSIRILVLVLVSEVGCKKFGFKALWIFFHRLSSRFALRSPALYGCWVVLLWYRLELEGLL